MTKYSTTRNSSILYTSVHRGDIVHSYCFSVCVSPRTHRCTPAVYTCIISRKRVRCNDHRIPPIVVNGPPEKCYNRYVTRVLRYRAVGCEFFSSSPNVVDSKLTIMRDYYNNTLSLLRTVVARVRHLRFRALFPHTYRETQMFTHTQ